MGHGRAKDPKNPTTEQGRSFVSGLIGSGLANTDLTQQKPSQGKAQTLEGILGAHKNVGRARSAKITRVPRQDMPLKGTRTLVGLNTPGVIAVRNPTAAITKRGRLIAKTRKPA